MGLAAIFIELEAPLQKIRLQNKIDLLQKVTDLRSNLSLAVKEKSPKAKKLFCDYVDTLEEYHLIPKEIEWEMLSASAFVNSVSSTTGTVFENHRKGLIQPHCSKSSLVCPKFQL